MKFSWGDVFCLCLVVYWVCLVVLIIVCSYWFLGVVVDGYGYCCVCCYCGCWVCRCFFGWLGWWCFLVVSGDWLYWLWCLFCSCFWFGFILLVGCVVGCWLLVGLVWCSLYDVWWYFGYGLGSWWLVCWLLVGSSVLVVLVGCLCFVWWIWICLGFCGVWLVVVGLVWVWVGW